MSGPARGTIPEAIDWYAIQLLEVAEGWRAAIAAAQSSGEAAATLVISSALMTAMSSFLARIGLSEEEIARVLETAAAEVRSGEARTAGEAS